MSICPITSFTALVGASLSRAHGQIDYEVSALIRISYQPGYQGERLTIEPASAISRARFKVSEILLSSFCRTTWSRRSVYFNDIVYQSLTKT